MFFIQEATTHTGVNISMKFTVCGNFAVNYKSVFCGKGRYFDLPNFSEKIYPLIHSPNSNRLFYKK